MTTAAAAAPVDRSGPGEDDQDPSRRPVAGLVCDAVQLVPVLGGLLLALVGMVGMVLGLLGGYRTLLACLLGGVPAVVLAVVWFRGRDRTTGTGSPAAAVGAVAALVLVGVWFGFAAWAPSQHVLLDRDPSVYQSTAVWLAEHGNLEIDASRGGLEQLPDGHVRYGGSAVYDMGSGTLQTQGDKLTSTALAVAYDLGGSAAMFRLPALVTAAALLAIYFVAARMTRRPLVALIAPAALAGGLPFLYVARDTYSEPFTVLLLWAAVMVLTPLHDRPRRGAAVVGGLLLGATVCVRSDALLFVALFVVLGVWSIVSSSDARQRRGRQVMVVTVAASVAVGLVVGHLDLHLRTGHYASDLGPELRAMTFGLLAAAVAAVIAVVAWPRSSLLRRLARPWGPRLAGAAVVLLVLVLLAGWLVRPHVQEAQLRSANDLVALIQRNQRLSVDATRSYSEQAEVWMSWYLGPVGFAVAIAGIALMAWRVLRSRADAATTVVLFLGLSLAVLYWWNPAITPDQLWVSRRYVPAVLPFLVLAAVAAVAAVASSGLRPWLRGTAVGALALVMVVPPAVRTWPIRSMAVQRGYLDAIEETCELIGPDATVLVLDGYGSMVLPQALRSWCGVPVAYPGPLFDGADFQALAVAAAAQGRHLEVLSLDDGLGSLPFGGPVRTTRPAPNSVSPEPTLSHLPDRYQPQQDTLPTSVSNPLTVHVRRIDP